MKRPAYTYRVEFLYEGHWIAPEFLKNETKGFALGYAFGHHDLPPPRNPSRVIRSDGKLIQEFPGNPDVALGMMAGFPTAEQYEAAAKRAMEKAEWVRKAYL